MDHLSTDDLALVRQLLERLAAYTERLIVQLAGRGLRDLPKHDGLRLLYLHDAMAALAELESAESAAETALAWKDHPCDEALRQAVAVLVNRPQRDPSRN